MMTQQGSIQDDREAQTTIADVRFEHYRDALGVGEARPRLSWIVATSTTGWRQTGYEIEAYGVDERLREQTGRVESDQSVLVSWPFAPLSSRERLMVRVRGWGNDGQLSAWSMLSFGWYRGQLGFNGGRRNIYGDRLALLAQLEIDYADGTTERIVTDEAWRATTGPILSSDIYDGETYDARLELPGWSTANYNAPEWTATRTASPITPPVIA